MISGAVGKCRFQKYRGADPFRGQGSLRRSYCRGGKPPIQALLFIRESRGDLTDNGIGTAVGTAVEDHKTVRCVEDKTLLMGEGIRSPAPFFLQVRILPDSFFLQSPEVLCGIR